MKNIKRPILVVLIGYIIGIIWGLYLSNLSIALFYLLFIIFYFIIKKFLSNIFYKLKFCRILRIFVSRNVILIILISSIISNSIILINNDRYENLYKNIKEERMIATVISDKTEKQYVNVYTIRIENINNNNNNFKGTKLLLKVKKNINIKYGDVVEFLGEYKEPNTKRNFGGFDYKEYLKSEKIFGIVENKDKIKIIKNDNIGFLYRFSNEIKNKIKYNVSQSFDNKTGSLLIGIILGDKDDITPEIIEDFKNSNLYHILAVSGAHISYLSIGVLTFLRKVKAGKKFSSLALIFILIFYMFITGFSPSVVRASIMGIVVLIASLINKEKDLINSISISLLIILISNPYSVMNLGLLLSYGGTIGIVLYSSRINSFLNKRFNKKDKKIKKSIISSLSVVLSAQIFIIPISLVNFNILNFNYFVSNILAGYIIGPIIILGFLFVIISIIINKFAIIIAYPLNLLLKILISISYFSSKIPNTFFYIITPSIFLVILYYLLIFFNYISYLINTKRKNTFLYIIKRKIISKQNIKKLFLVVLIISIFINLFKIIPGNLIIHFIDVRTRGCNIYNYTTKKEYFN